MRHSKGIQAVFAGAVVLGAMYDIGILLAAGIAGAFISLSFLPVFYLTAKKVHISSEGSVPVPRGKEDYTAGYTV